MGLFKRNPPPDIVAVDLHPLRGDVYGVSSLPPPDGTITPAMIEAARNAMFDADEAYLEPGTLALIYRAMRAAAR